MKLLLVGLLTLGVCALAIEVAAEPHGETEVLEVKKAADSELEPLSVNKDLETAKKALEVARSFVDIFTIKMFEKASFFNVAQIVQGILSFTISIINLVMGIHTQESAEIAAMRKEFGEVFNRLDRISLKLDEVMRLLEWQTTRGIYARYELEIKANTKLLDRYVAENNANQREYFKNAFMNSFEKNPLAALKLYQAIVETDLTVTDNLSVAVVHYTQNHQSYVMNFLLAMQRLIMRGAQNEITYERMKRGDHAASVVQNLWNSRMENLLRRMQSVDSQVKSQYLTQMSTDLDVHIGNTGHLGHVDFVKTVFPIIKDKFGFRKWVLCSYVPVWGFDIHTVSVCGGTHRFRAHGNRNVVIASSDPRTSRFTIASGNAALDFAQQMHSGWFAVHWNEWIRRAAPDCNSAALVFTLRGPHFVNCGYTDDSSFVYRRIFKDGDMQAMVFG